MAYTVSAPDTAKDQDDTDIWIASWDGTAAGPAHPEPGRRARAALEPGRPLLAFLSDRDDPREVGPALAARPRRAASPSGSPTCRAG